jgi:hypothetical protein
MQLLITSKGEGQQQHMRPYMGHQLHGYIKHKIQPRQHESQMERGTLMA